MVFRCWRLYNWDNLMADFSSGQYFGDDFLMIFSIFFMVFDTNGRFYACCRFGRKKIWPEIGPARSVLLKKIQNLTVGQKLAEISSNQKMLRGGKLV